MKKHNLCYGHYSRGIHKIGNGFTWINKKNFFFQFGSELQCYLFFRLGAGTKGIEDIKNHEFFASIEWEALLRKEVYSYHNFPLQTFVFDLHFQFLY